MGDSALHHVKDGDHISSVTEMYVDDLSNAGNSSFMKQMELTLIISNANPIIYV